MTDLISFINNNLNLTILILIGLEVLLILLVLILLLQNLQTRKRLKVFFSGRQAKDLEGVIAEEIKRQVKNEKDIKGLFQSYRELFLKSTKSVQKVGIVRFNPFRDIGGDQSFAIALLDENNNGLVVSSLYTRVGTRVYAKPIENGISKYPLSKEEKQAIQEAQEESPK